MNRLYVMGQVPYSDSDERLHAIESLRFKLIAADKIRQEWHDRCWAIGGFCLVVACLWVIIWGFATRF